MTTSCLLSCLLILFHFHAYLTCLNFIWLCPLFFIQHILRKLGLRPRIKAWWKTLMQLKASTVHPGLSHWCDWRPHSILPTSFISPSRVMSCHNSHIHFNAFAICVSLSCTVFFYLFSVFLFFTIEIQDI
jgi:hypothetical protein